MLNIYLNDEQIENAKIFQIIGSKDKAIAKAAADNAVKVVVEFLENKHLFIGMEPEEGVPCEYVGCYILKWGKTIEPEILFTRLSDDKDWQALKELANKGVDNY